METARARARRIFEEVLAEAQRVSLLKEDVMVVAQALNAQGQQVVVARYKLHVDGRIECFEVLDDVLWPSL